MLSATIHSTLNVPARSPTTSSRSLQWTPDGQLILLGESIIYLLTPETGINLNPNHRGASGPKSSHGMTWLTTVILLPATDLFWPEISPDWGTLCIGAVDYNWDAVTYSPTGCSKVGSCLLATLSSNLEVYLWAPNDDPYRGKWEKIQDITHDLSSYIQNQNLSSVQSTLTSQVQSLCWSSQPSVLSHDPSASLLALGTRRGSVLLLRLEEGKLNVVASIVGANSWITHMAWTKWMNAKAENAITAQLACALPNGHIILLQVDQTWDSSVQNPALKVTVTKINEKAYLEDRRNITSMEWINLDNAKETPNPILVHCRPGTVGLWRQESQEPGLNSWAGHRSVKLNIIPTSTASTNMAQASGIIYLVQHDILIVSLMDGSYHAIHSLSENPTLFDHGIDVPICTSSSLSSTARSAFLVSEFHEREIPKDGSEPPKLYHNHVARTTGALPVDSGGVVLWVHQKIFSESFEYTPDSKIRCLIVAASLTSPNDYDRFALQEIRLCLQTPSNLLLQAPTATLRGAYIHLRRKDFVQRNKDAILSLLSPGSVQGRSRHQDHTIESEEWADEARKELTVALFTHDELCKERLKLNMALVCSSLFPGGEFKNQCQALRERIHASNLLIVFDWLRQLPPNILRESGSFFTTRMLRQAHMSPSISDSIEIKAFLDIFHEEISDTEPCPACGGAIESDDPSLGECENGHYWSRCSATSYILSTPEVRSCVCCGNKIMQPAGLSLGVGNEQKNELLANVVLAAMQSCGICGNKYVKMA